MDFDQLINFLKAQEDKIQALENENMELRYENAALRDMKRELERKAS